MVVLGSTEVSSSTLPHLTHEGPSHSLLTWHGRPSYLPPTLYKIGFLQTSLDTWHEGLFHSPLTWWVLPPSLDIQCDRPSHPYTLLPTLNSMGSPTYPWHMTRRAFPYTLDTMAPPSILGIWHDGVFVKALLPTLNTIGSPTHHWHKTWRALHDGYIVLMAF